MVISRRAGHVARVGEERGVYGVLVGKLEGRRPLGIPRRRWVDNIRMNLQEVGCGHMDWIGLAQDIDKSFRTYVNLITFTRFFVEYMSRYIEKNEMGWACGAYG